MDINTDLACSLNYYINNGLKGQSSQFIIKTFIINTNNKP